MDRVTVVAIATLCASVACQAVRAWAWQRVARSRQRDAACAQYLRRLPRGSRIVDLGEHGVLAEVGGADRSADGCR